MQRNYKILLVAAFAVILILSSLVGFMLARITSEKKEIPTATQIVKSEVEEFDDEAEKVSSVFRIKLDDDVLKLYHEDAVIKEAVITPEIYPSGDIHELKVGTIYETMEEALVDWESLCE